MKYSFYFLFTLIWFLGDSNIILSQNFIPANNRFIQYFGRWDMSDSLHPNHSWPGNYVVTKFSGTSIGIRMNDNVNYYNIYIDGKFHNILHGKGNIETDYMIVSNLPDTIHSVLINKRNIAFGQVFSFSGFLIDDKANLLQPPAKPDLKIEFIGDSFTAAESNEAKVQELEWEKRFPVTNIDKGFAPIIANHYNAQYHTTCRSGSGMLCNWQGDFEVTIPKIFDRTLIESEHPKWNFNEWIPDLVVICLGLNDLSGLKDSTGKVLEENSLLFRKAYHDFLITIRKVYPDVKILAVAAFPDWIRENVLQVVKDENSNGNNDIFYAQFDYFPDGYVANGHPTVETHQKMANQLIEAIDSLKIFSNKSKILGNTK